MVRIREWLTAHLALSVVVLAAVLGGSLAAVGVFRPASTSGPTAAAGTTSRTADRPTGAPSVGAPTVGAVQTGTSAPTLAPPTGPAPSPVAVARTVGLNGHAAGTGGPGSTSASAAGPTSAPASTTVAASPSAPTTPVAPPPACGDPGQAPCFHWPALGPVRQSLCSHTPGSDTWDLEIQVMYSRGAYVVNGVLNQGSTWWLTTTATGTALGDGSGWVVADVTANAPVLYDPFSGAAMGRASSPLNAAFPGC